MGIGVQLRMPAQGLALLAAGLCLLTGCKTRRILSIESDPPGAQVRLDDELIGRTPLEHEFDHYGVRRLTMYLGGYLTYSERLTLDAPWHASFPVDVITEVLIPMGLTDRHQVSIVLEPDLELGEDLDVTQIIQRAREVRETVVSARIGRGAVDSSEQATQESTDPPASPDRE
ncbi:MAG: hypothetical protein ACI841_000974 [Planctomycetota bacterium]|jgi:hypothetical protein